MGLPYSLGEKETLLAARPGGALVASVPRNNRSTLLAALKDANSLVDMGVPIFPCQLKSNGDPIPPKQWEKIEPSSSQVGRWNNGMGLCATTGVVFDVIDIDPRNGGQLSLKRLAKTLGDDGPEIYWEVRTASGGKHLYISPLGIGTVPGFLPGIDLKGGKPDGTSRGFVFIPPTVRPSKAEENTGSLISYQSLSGILPPLQNGSIDTLRDFIEKAQTDKSGGTPTGREDVSKLKQDCLDAQPGMQRSALLRYTHELERKGYERSDIVTILAALVGEMPVYNKRRPWRIADLRGLLHKPGEVVPDGTPGEKFALTPQVRRGGLQSFSSVTHEVTRWGWHRYLAFGDFTILDGDPGSAKSLCTLDVASRWSTGRPMPGEAESGFDGGNVLLLAPEDRATVTAGRIQAAGGDPDRIFRPKLGTIEIERKTRAGVSKEKRATYDGDIMVFPDSIRLFKQWIMEYNISLVVIDPVPAFLSERTNSNNDASVRRALEPLVIVLGEAECAGFGIRHLNKNTSQDARYRGGGSIAFGAVSRIQLLAGELPDGTGRFGIAQIKNNHLAKRPDEVLTYQVEDSEVVADEFGNMVPRIAWGDYINMTLRALSGGPEKRGPKPERRQEISEVLEEMFSQQATWSVKEAEAQLRASGCSVNHAIVDKARSDLGIFARASYKPGGGVAEWVWTTEPRKHKRGG